jgi:N-acetyl sugar amidotransferase
MNFCKRCLYPSNHPLNLVFDDEGICSGCRIHEEKDIINWQEKEEKLKNLLFKYKSSSGGNYDCIIPVSGAKDSHFIVHTVKNVYGLNPLLVTYNKQYNTPQGIRNLANLRIKFDCDIMTLTINPEIVKKVTRATIRKMGSIYWHCLAGQTVFPVQIAVKFKIPLIVWGAHQGIDQVGMFSHSDQVEMTRKYRKEHDLLGYEAEDLIDDFDGITFEDIHQFIYPDDREIEQIGVRGIYLNNYIRWDSKAQHELMIAKWDFETNIQTRTFDTYNDVDCFNYSDVHDYIKYIKHGYGKVTDHVCREIRLRRMTREQGIEFINQKINMKPKFLSLFLDWIGMTEYGFYYLIDQHRNMDIWRRNDSWEWELKHSLLPENENKDKVEKARLKLNQTWSDFILTPKKNSPEQENQYTLIGKGIN